MKLSRVNNILLALIIAVDGYVIAAPIAPSLLLSPDSSPGKKQALERKIQPSPKDGASKISPLPNQVIVPSMLLDQPILEGKIASQYKTLNKGVWRWPRGSTPDKGGNTILIGHRFTYTNPRGVFYFLNKVSLGDEIGVVWKSQKYLYKVVSISQVPPTDTAIEDQGSQPELTLFTCTPLWLPKDRLVVVADLENGP